MASCLEIRVICEGCNQNVATVHLTEIVKQTKKEVHLCEACAEERGVTKKAPFSISDLLGGLAEPQPAEKEEAAAPTQDCPRCGLSYADFRAHGRLGCPEDYRVFGKLLLPLLEKIHGNTQHLGRVPKRAGERVLREKELMQLREELRRAIDREEYEHAAELRDRIYRLKEPSGGNS
ncbi:MAG: UvrB/UvrC motif-containing protein [Planctomycetes bacterium]|nr:UvrB/UvrC motif-containing protein [Planctomycetota bacterium]